MSKKGILIGLVIFQVLIIAGMLLKAMLPLLTGQEIELKVAARDPRDVFRGDYAALNYEFNQVSLDSIPNDIPPDAAFNYGDVLFVELKKAGRFYAPSGVWISPPANGSVFLKTIVEYPFRNIEGQYPFLSLQAGIESYFTDPKTAKTIEEDLRDQTVNENAPVVSATVMVTSAGEARIKRINVSMAE